MNTPTKLLYSKREFCTDHSVSASTFHRLVAAGRLRVTKIGKKTLVSAEAAREFRRNIGAEG